MNAVVTVPVCPLMTSPAYTCATADEALFGMTVAVLGCPRPGWYLVRTHYRYEGYAPAECLLIDDDRTARWAALPKQVVLRGYCTVLNQPRVQGWTLTGLTRGAVVAAADTPNADGWQTVLLPNGKTGYTKSSFLGEYHEIPPQLTQSALRARIVSAALPYLGTHYRWGGKSTLGIDCSGLTSMAYLLNGIVIYRDARMPEGFPVREIARADLAPADLIFFPGHVALYLGDGKFLHSTAKPGSDGVVINSLTPGEDDYRADLAHDITAIGSIFSRSG